MKKKDLEILLQQVPPPDEPQINLEQYMTPAHIAADILWHACYNGDIAGKTVVDLGCGTGIFALGAALLDAKMAVGIDVDERLIEKARHAAEKLGVSTVFHAMAIRDYAGHADTVIMNPPFGAQYANRKADSMFIQHALTIAKSIYSLHLENSATFIVALIEQGGWIVNSLTHYRFPLKASYAFHKKKSSSFDVVMIHARRATIMSPPR